MIGFFFIMLMFIFMMFVCVYVLSSLLNSFGGWNSTYEKLAKRYGGKAKRGLLAKPKLNFDYRRTHCVLKNLRGKRNIENRTQMQIRWPDRNLAMHVSSEGTLAANQNWLNRNLSNMNLENNDNGVALHGFSNHTKQASSLLTPGVRWQIRQLQNHTSQKGIVVRIDRGKMYVEKPGYIKDHGELDDFVRYCLELFDQMMLTKTEGMEFVETMDPTVVSDVKCPICSQQVVRDMVVCVRCKSPHCGDCWEYNGGCATFACNESRFVRTDQQSNIAG